MERENDQRFHASGLPDADDFNKCKLALLMLMRRLCMFISHGYQYAHARWSKHQILVAIGRLYPSCLGAEFDNKSLQIE